MKPPKAMKKTVLSFFGGKKKSLPFDTSQKVIEDNAVCSRRNSTSITDQRRMVKHNQSPLGERTVSLPLSTRRRIEEWNQRACPEFDPEIEEGMRRTLSATSKRSHEIRNLKHQSQMKSNRSTSSYDTRGSHTRSLESREITPWDSVSRTSSHIEPLSQRDSGTFDMYVNEEITSSEMFPNSDVVQNRTHNHCVSGLKRYNSDSHIYREPRRVSRTLPTRTTSFSSQQFNRLRPRTISRASNVSEKLLNCMDTLEQLSKKLESITVVSSEVEKFQKVTGKILSSNELSARTSQCEPKAPRNRMGWSIGDEVISNTNPVYQNSERKRLRSYESSSTDSGVNSTFEFVNKSNETNPSLRPRSNAPTSSILNELDQKVQYSHPVKSAHLRSSSLSSGYSSGSGENRKSQSQIAPLNYYPSPHPAVSSQLSYDQNYPNVGYNPQYPQNDPTYPNANGKEFLGSGYNQEYGNEDVYGTFGYASSSVYEEDLNQNNGWFYLPSVSQTDQVAYQSQLSQYVQGATYAPQQPYYPSDDMAYPTQQCYYPTQTWQGESYGVLSQPVLHSSSGISPLTAPTLMTCTEDHGSSVTSESKDLKKIGSFRYRNGERTAVSSSGMDSRRRKTVRFSQTVKQRVETDESEMEDSTSLIKGEVEEHESEYNSPSSIEVASPSTGSDVNTQQPKNISEHTIYEFPSGHIESSCMCSDCILARGSSQLQPAASFVYY